MTGQSQKQTMCFQWILGGNQRWGKVIVKGIMGCQVRTFFFILHILHYVCILSVFPDYWERHGRI